MSVLGQFAKAIYSAVFAGLSGLSTVLVGDTTFTHVQPGQWVSIALFALGAGGGVYGLTNKTAGP